MLPQEGGAATKAVAASLDSVTVTATASQRATAPRVEDSVASVASQPPAVGSLGVPTAGSKRGLEADGSSGRDAGAALGSAPSSEPSAANMGQALAVHTVRAVSYAALTAAFPTTVNLFAPSSAIDDPWCPTRSSVAENTEGGAMAYTALTTMYPTTVNLFTPSSSFVEKDLLEAVVSRATSMPPLPVVIGAPPTAELPLDADNTSPSASYAILTAAFPTTVNLFAPSSVLCGRDALSSRRQRGVAAVPASQGPPESRRVHPPTTEAASQLDGVKKQTVPPALVAAILAVVPQSGDITQEELAKRYDVDL